MMRPTPHAALPPHTAMGRAAAAAVIACSLIACGGEGDADVDPVTLSIAFRETPPLRPVLETKLTSFGVTARQDDDMARELRTDLGTMPGGADAAEPSETVDGARSPDTDAGLDEGLVEMRDGLVGMVTSDPRKLALARADVENLAAEMVPVLAAGLRDPSRSVAELKVLADFSAVAPNADLARALVEIAATHDDAWMRRYAAWSLLPHAKAEGADATIPALLRRLKYERDQEGFVWVAAALAAFQNLSGLPALFDLAALPAGDPIGDAARTQVASIVADAGAASGDELWAEWSAGTRGREDGASVGLRAELWLLVADLSGEHFQLRGVDDARHVLSRLGPWAGVQLGEALSDTDEYVRLHVAQCLERMGPRGRLATDPLMTAIDDSSDAVAGAACEALVAVAGAAATEPLMTRLRAKRSHAFKVAVVRALGRVPDAPLDVLQAEFEQEGAPVDMRLAAAEGLVRGGRGVSVVPWLAAALTDRFGDPAGTEALAEIWVAADSDDAARVSLRVAWEGLAAPAAVIHTEEQVRERRRLRAELLRTYLE